MSGIGAIIDGCVLEAARPTSGAAAIRMVLFVVASVAEHLGSDTNVAKACAAAILHALAGLLGDAVASA